MKFLRMRIYHVYRRNHLLVFGQYQHFEIRGGSGVGLGAWKNKMYVSTQACNVTEVYN